MSCGPVAEEGEMEVGEGKRHYRLRLFVAGHEPNSVRAVAILRRLCEGRLKGRSELEIVDVFQDYEAAIAHKVVAVPTLLVESPPPPRVIVGSLGKEDELLCALGLCEEGGGSLERGEAGV